MIVPSSRRAVVLLLALLVSSVSHVAAFKMAMYDDETCGAAHETGEAYFRSSLTDEFRWPTPVWPKDKCYTKKYFEGRNCSYCTGGVGNFDQYGFELASYMEESNSVLFRSFPSEGCLPTSTVWAASASAPLFNVTTLQCDSCVNTRTMSLDPRWHANGTFSHHARFQLHVKLSDCGNANGFKYEEFNDDACQNVRQNSLTSKVKARGMAPVADLEFQWPSKECHAYGRLGAMSGADSTQYTIFEKTTYQPSSNGILYERYDDAWCSDASHSGRYQCDKCSNTTTSPSNGGVITRSSTKTTGCNEKSSKWLIYTSDDCTPGTENRSSVFFFYSPQSTFTKSAPREKSYGNYARYAFARANKTDGSMLPPVFERLVQGYDYASQKPMTDHVQLQRYNDPFFVDYKTTITNCSGWGWSASCTSNIKCDTTCVSEKYSSTSRRITDCAETVPAPNYPSYPPRPPPSPPLPPFRGTDINARLVNVTSSSGFYSGRLEVWSSSSAAWGTVCDDSFTTVDAVVVCKQLGYPTSFVSYKGSAYFGQGSGNILMDEVSCTGTESNIGQCPHFSSHDCVHGEDVGVICSSLTPPTPPTPPSPPPWQPRPPPSSPLPPWQPSPPPAFCEHDGFTIMGYEDELCATVASTFGEKNFTTVYWHKLPPSMKLINPGDIRYPKETCYSVINGTNEKSDKRPESRIAIYDQAVKSMRFYHFQDGFCKTPKSWTASSVDQYDISVVQCDICTPLNALRTMFSMVTGCADATFRILTYTSAACAAGTEINEQFKFYDGKDESSRGLQRVATIPNFAWPVNFCYTWTNDMNGHRHGKSTYIKETNTMRHEYYNNAQCRSSEWSTDENKYLSSALDRCDTCYADGSGGSYKVSECKEISYIYTMYKGIGCNAGSEDADVMNSRWFHSDASTLTAAAVNENIHYPYDKCYGWGYNNETDGTAHGVEYEISTYNKTDNTIYYQSFKDVFCETKWGPPELWQEAGTCKPRSWFSEYSSRLVHCDTQPPPSTPTASITPVLPAPVLSPPPPPPLITEPVVKTSISMSGASVDNGLTATQLDAISFYYTYVSAAAAFLSVPWSLCVLHLPPKFNVLN